jgi:hypothetical protein
MTELARAGSSVVGLPAAETLAALLPNTASRQMITPATSMSKASAANAMDK